MLSTCQPCRCRLYMASDTPRHERKRTGGRSKYRLFFSNTSGPDDLTRNIECLFDKRNIQGPVHTCLIEALCPKWGQSRRKERSLVNPNKRQATPNGPIWGTALREVPFLYAATLFLADVHLAHGARNALQRNKNGYFATARISVNRP